MLLLTASNIWTHQPEHVYGHSLRLLGKMVCASLEKSSWLNGLRWPSPDLNPVEHLWDAVERLTGSMNMQLTNLHKWCEGSCQEADFWRKVSKISSRTQRKMQPVLCCSYALSKCKFTTLDSLGHFMLCYDFKLHLAWMRTTGWRVNFFSKI